MDDEVKSWLKKTYPDMEPSEYEWTSEKIKATPEYQAREEKELYEKIKATPGYEADSRSVIEILQATPEYKAGYRAGKNEAYGVMLGCLIFGVVLPALYFGLQWALAWMSGAK
jgi:hypothetical protein